MSENRCNSALYKRAEQLKRWQESETFREPSSLKRKKSRIVFSDGCIFLAACSAGDKEEVRELLEKGVDVNTSNIDGLTALHQACIDDNLDMVEFLVEMGADVDRGDNEGWTPLHATANCGFFSIARFLLDKNASLAAVNNDGELPIDICETDDMTQLLQEYIDARGIDCDKWRAEEQCLLVADARRWYAQRYVDETPHPSTGAFSVHVAAAKGYIQALSLLLKAGVDVNCQDYDGWTPLHAAAHWAQPEACQVLADNLCNMHLRNCVDLTAFDVADPSVLDLLEQLNNKQLSLAREQPEVGRIIKRQPVSVAKRRPSAILSRLSQPAIDVVAEHRQRTQQQQQQQRRKSSVNDISGGGGDFGVDGADETKAAHIAATVTSVALSPTRTLSTPSVTITAPQSPTNTPQSATNALQSVTTAPRSATNASHSTTTVAPQSTISASHSVANAPRHTPAAVDTQPLCRVASTVASTASAIPDVQLRRLSSGDRNGAAANVAQRGTPATTTADTVSVSDQTAAATHTPSSSVHATMPTVRRSFVPPVRDEESETQRKAHAKRVRETRRSTQGVTLEELKSAEQYVKNQQQQKQERPPVSASSIAVSFSDRRHSESSGGIKPLSTTNSDSSAAGAGHSADPEEPSTASSPSSAGSSAGLSERRPSWRLRLDDNDKNKFSLEEVRSCVQAAAAAKTASAALSSSASHTASHPLPACLSSTSAVSASATVLTTTTACGESPERPTASPSVNLSSPERPPPDTTITLPLRRRTSDASAPTQRHLNQQQQQSRDVVSSIATRAEQEPTSSVHSSSSAPGDSGRSSEQSPGSASTASSTATAAAAAAAAAVATQGVIHRRRKPKRRSTGVVQFDPDTETDKESANQHQQSHLNNCSVSSLAERTRPSGDNKTLNSASSEDVRRSPPAADSGRASSLSSTATSVRTPSSPTKRVGGGVASTERVENGEVDYKKLYEEAMLDNDRLRRKLSGVEDEFRQAKLQADKYIQMANSRVAAAVCDSRESRCLERKLAEMEEELKSMNEVRSENRRLRDENGALIRVISKLSK